MLCEDIQSRLVLFGFNLTTCAVKQQFFDDHLILKEQQFIIKLLL